MGQTNDDDRLVFIQNVSRALSRADSVEEVAGVCVAHCLSALGANAGSVYLLSPDRQLLMGICCLGYPPDVSADFHTYPVSLSVPTADVARTGELIFIETLAERDHLYPHLAEHSTLMERGAAIALPLVVSDRILGSLGVNFPHDRPFPNSERIFIQSIVQVCAQALERQLEIDDRRAAEQALYDAETRKAAILEAALDAIVTIDDEGRVVDWNPAAVQTFGYTQEQAIGHILAELIIPASMREAHLKGIAHYLMTGKGPLLYNRTEVVALNSDGEEVPIEVAILPIRLKDRNLFTAYIRDIRERKEIAMRQWRFIRDMLLAVTDSKLLLCESEKDLPIELISVGEPIQLTRQAGTFALRQMVSKTSDELGFSDDRCYDMLTAASEAGMNAIVHAGGGEAEIFLEPESGKLQIKISDHGKGIALDQLPKAALTRGFSTTSTLGHGLKMMVETMDRVFLLTNQNGTTTVLEQDRVKPLPPWLLN